MLMVERSPSRARKARAPPFLCGSRFSLLGTLHDSRVACLRFSPSGAYCFAIYLVRWSQTKEDAMFTMSVKRRLFFSALAVAGLLMLSFSSPLGSGERRVGEEGRSRWAADYLKKKKNLQCDAGCYLRCRED